MSTVRKPVPTEKRNALRYSPAALLTIRVGKSPKQQDFVAHESFLTCRSEFLRRAVNGRWEEAETRLVKLPEDSPGVFALYLDCAYTNKVTSELLDREPTSNLGWEDAKTLASSDVHNLTRLYILADKLQDPATKEAVIKMLYKVVHYQSRDKRIWVPGSRHISFIYENTPDHSPIRRLIVYPYLNRSPERLREKIARLPKEFLLELAIARQHGASAAKRVVRKNGVEAYLEDSVLEQPEAESSLSSSQQGV